MLAISQFYRRKGLRVTGNQEDRKDCDYRVVHSAHIIRVPEKPTKKNDLLLK